MVKISLDGTNYLFCALHRVVGSCPMRGRGWGIGHPPPQLTQPDLRQMRRQRRVECGQRFTSPQRLRGLWCGCGNRWKTKEIIGNKPTLPSSHHLLLSIAFTKVLFYFSEVNLFQIETKLRKKHRTGVGLDEGGGGQYKSSYLSKHCDISCYLVGLHVYFHGYCITPCC